MALYKFIALYCIVFSRAQSVTHAFGGRVPPGLAGGASALPRPLAAIRGGVLLLREREEMGREKEGDWKEEERGGGKKGEGKE